MNDEKVLDADQWKEEAKAVINDIRAHLKSAEISGKIECSNNGIYLNLTTIEGQEICVELSGYGFRVVGNEHDTVQFADGDYFETPYSLLNSVSPGYTSSFGNALFDKLTNLDRENARN